MFIRIKKKEVILCKNECWSDSILSTCVNDEMCSKISFEYMDFIMCLDCSIMRVIDRYIFPSLLLLISMHIQNYNVNIPLEVHWFNCSSASLLCRCQTARNSYLTLPSHNYRSFLVVTMCTFWQLSECIFISLHILVKELELIFYFIQQRRCITAMQVKILYIKTSIRYFSKIHSTTHTYQVLPSCNFYSIDLNIICFELKENRYDGVSLNWKFLWKCSYFNFFGD